MELETSFVPLAQSKNLTTLKKKLTNLTANLSKWLNIQLPEKSTIMVHKITIDILIFKQTESNKHLLKNFYNQGQNTKVKQILKQLNWDVSLSK